MPDESVLLVSAHGRESLPAALNTLLLQEKAVLVSPDESAASTAAGLLAAARAKDAAGTYTHVICLGFSLSYAAAKARSFEGRFMAYVDDAPGQGRLLYPGVCAKLGEIAGQAVRLLVSDEDERSHLEAFVPESAGKVQLLHEILLSPSQPLTGHTKAPVRVLLAGHDFKFAGELARHLEAHPGFSLRTDEWESLHRHDEERSLRELAQADVVICEWAGGNAVWYARHIGAHQRLIIRLHGFEVQGEWLKDIDISAVHTVVLVSGFFREQVLETTGWPREKTMVIPNTVDTSDFCRPKEEDAAFRLGLVGMVPLFKRPDRALDILEELLRYDERFTLHIRSRYPWEYDWFWNGRPAEQDAYRMFFGRLRADRKLMKHVAFEPVGADMASWFRRIGFCLSTSYRETFHVAPLEGAASGSVPVLLDRPGAAEIFDPRWVFSDAKSAAEFIRSAACDADDLARESEAARDFSHRYDIHEVVPRWGALIEDALR
ncbi:glycosyltransferase family 4 protein [Arthrobacter sp. NPDC055585]